MRTTLTIEKDVAARAPSRFSVKARDFGAAHPDVSLDNTGALLQCVEGPDRA